MKMPTGLACVLLTAVSLGLAAPGCARPRPTYDAPYQTQAAVPGRDAEAARRLNARALNAVAAGDLAKAEQLLKESLAADLFFGPAHNNLGLVYYRQEKFYLAAWEFQYAAKLMTGHPEPRNNLGLVYEAVGRLDEAENHYDEALKLAPDNVECLGNLARTRMKAGRKDARTRQLLADLVLKDSRPTWLAWARRNLTLLAGAEESRQAGDHVSGETRDSMPPAQDAEPLLSAEEHAETPTAVPLFNRPAAEQPEP